MKQLLYISSCLILKYGPNMKVEYKLKTGCHKTIFRYTVCKVCGKWRISEFLAYRYTD